MTKERLRIIIGENIRNERIARSISIDELAEMLELTSGFVGLIERGQRGTTPITLFKLADVFGLSIDSFFYNDNNISLGEEMISKSQVKRKKIESLISDFTEKELDFTISILKSLRVMNHSQIPEDDIDEDLEDSDGEFFEEKL